MTTASLRLAACVPLMLLLAACAGSRVRPQQADTASLVRQLAREQALATHANWTLRGRLGVSDGRDSGSGSLEWTQSGDAFRFSVHAPVTGKTWVLQDRDGRVVLEGLREQPVEGDDAARLLERELGWRVPVAELVHWARGMRAAGPAQVTFRGDGLPATIEQAGWRVEYLDYDDSREPPLPRKVFASHGNYKVRLAIREWTLE
jgi:outer membrane lipoprotein LolB